MKLLKLVLHDFLNHAHSELELSGLTVVAGGNNAGKSAIKDAVQFLLTGTARTTDKRGAGAEDLKRVGSGKMEVWADIEAGGQQVTVTRRPGQLEVLQEIHWGGKIADKQRELYKLLGADGRVIRACLHAGSLPELPPDEQEALIFDLMALEYAPDAIMTLLEKHGCGEDDLKLLWNPDMESMRGAADARLDSGAYTFEVFKLLYQEAYNIRKGVRKHTKNCQATVNKEEAAESALIQAIPALGGIEDLEAKAIALETGLATLRTERDRLVVQMGQLPDVAALEATRNRLTEKSTSLTEELEKVAQWESRKAELFGTLILPKLAARLEAEREEIEKDQAVTKARIKALRSTARTFKERPVCPLMDRDCPLDSEARAGVVQTLTGRADEFNRRDLPEHQARLDKVMAKLVPLRELNVTKGRDMAVIEADADDVTEELAKLPAETGQDVDRETLEHELAELTARVEAGPGKVSAVRAYGAQRDRTVEARAKLEQAAAELESWERLCKALGSGGIRGRAIQEPLKELTARINERLHEYLPSHRVELLGPDGFELRVYGPASAERALPIKGLSTSERLRVGVALQDALCHLTGLRFLLVDNVDMLDPGNRNKLMEALGAMAKDYDTIMVLATADGQDAALGLRAARTYWVEAGVVTDISLNPEKVAA